MKLFENIMDFGGFLFERIKDLFLYIFNLLLDLARSLYEKFLDVNFAEKVIFVNILLTFFAIILPVARYYIFKTYYYINNPLSVYLIGIAIIMFITIYFEGHIKFLIRIVLNIYYLFWIIYLPLANELTKANPHEICTGYYLNIAAPIVYIIFSLLSRFVYSE